MTDRLLGIEDMALVCGHTPFGNLFLLTCGRGGDFSAPEKANMAAFQRIVKTMAPFCGLNQPFASPLGKIQPPPGGLTRREEEILHWVKQGKHNAEIAALLGLSSHTVRHHLEHAYAKLGVTNRVAALAYLASSPALQAQKSSCKMGRSSHRRGL